MKNRGVLYWNTLTCFALLVVCSFAFVPQAARSAANPRRLFYTTGEASAASPGSDGFLLAPQNVPLLSTRVTERHDDIKPVALQQQDSKEQLATFGQKNASTTRTAHRFASFKPFSWLRSAAKSVQTRWNRLTQTLQSEKPSVRFRVQLGVAVLAAAGLSNLWVSPRWVWATTRHWITHRGFQGIAALGRSAAYVWALLVAYPRMLDKRAQERERNRRDQALERRRHHLRSLAAEVARLRHEMSAIDKEMRTFRREIIAFQVNGAMTEQVQEAIDAEMSHLAQLRADTHAALAAARKEWADVRARSPPELWEDTLSPESIPYV